MHHLAKNLLVAIILMMPTLLSAQTKRALIIAIGDYPAETNWRAINSLHDVPLIQTALQQQGFSDFTILKNEEASKKGIVTAIQQLTKTCKKGDIVVLHFSSHGQQISDDGDDELDGFDEAIVAYGAYTAFGPNYKGENHLRDDELEVLIDGLREAVGAKGDVLMIADACHSGTISRGEEISRGGQPPMIDPSHLPKSKGKPDVGLYQQTTQSRGDGDKAPFVLISASQAAEVNYEYKGAGSLSTAINRCVSKMDNNMSYRAWFAQILKEMSQLAPNQIPAIEGDIDRKLFGGNAVSQEPFYTAYKILDVNLNLNGGTLNGLFPGTEVAIYPSGTANMREAEPLATGSIVNAEGTWAKAKMNKTLSGQPKDYWVFVTKQTYGDIKVKVKINTGNKSSNESIANALKDFGLVELVSDQADFEITDGGRGDVDIMRIGDKSIFAEGVSSDKNYAALKEELKNFAKGHFIKDLEIEYPGIDLSFEFIPVRIDEEGNIVDTLTIEEISTNGVMKVTPSIAVRIKVTNNGTKPAYFAIVDIQPNGVINGIIPDPDPQSGHTPEQFLIQPKTSYIIPNHKVIFGEPYGAEVFKLFATKDKVDFRPILSGLGRTRSEMSEMEVLFSDSINAATRGGKSTSVSSGMEASTYSLSFQIQAD